MSGVNYIRPSLVFLDNEIVSDDDLIVEGNINASRIDVKTNTIVVSRESEINADINAGNIQIIGRVNGNISAGTMITLEDTAQVNGDLSAPQVVISKNARLQGTISYT